jgi:hypothetical protein
MVSPLQGDHPEVEWLDCAEDISAPFYDQMNAIRLDA